MNKLVKVLAASAMVASVLVGCSKEAKFAKAGLGVVSSWADGQVNTTFVGLGLDKDGKIQYIDLDVAQSSPRVEGKEFDQTKEERKEGYGMKKASPLGKEWYEQAEAFETYCKGKTVKEVLDTKVYAKDEHHNAVPAEGSDLAAGCTMNIGDFLDALKKAEANAEEVEAENIVLGRVMSNNDKKQLNTTLALVATDADGKIVYNKLDVAQIYEGTTETKGERKEAYDMKKASPIGKEWYEQAAAWEAYCNGKTIDDIKGLELAEGKATDADLTAGCTMAVAEFVEAYKKAK